MYKQTTIMVIITFLFCVMQGCISPNAVKTDIQGVRNDMGQLEKLVDQKADNTVIAEQVDQINNRIEQTAQIAEELSVWKKNIQAETINYGGAGWVVIGTGIMALIFVGAGLLIIRAFMKRGNMLALLTRAVKISGTGTITTVKEKLQRCVDKGHHCDRDRKNLGYFARKVGTFAEQK